MKRGKLSENSIFSYTSPTFCLTIKSGGIAKGDAKMGSHILHYTAPAKQWNEALPLGNGRIGAMIYGGTEKEILCMNEDTVWSGYPKTPVKEGAKEAYEKAQKLALEGKNAEAQAGPA